MKRNFNEVPGFSDFSDGIDENEFASITTDDKDRDIKPDFYSESKLRLNSKSKLDDNQSKLLSMNDNSVV